MSEHSAPSEFAGRSVTVMGLGLFGGGAGVARWLAQRGAHVTVTDLRDEDVLAPARESLSDLDLRFVLGRHEEADFRQAHMIVANPAVPPSSPYLELARRAGVPVTSEVALFLERTHGRCVAVSGTQGKSSTAHFLAQLARKALDPYGGRTHLGGNIGGSLLDELGGVHAGDRVVIELSSYQLESLPARPSRRVEVAAITNLLADHLERHGSVEAYHQTKLRLFELLRPDGVAFLPAETPAEVSAGLPMGVRLLRFGKTADGIPLELREGCFCFEGELLGRVRDLRLKGRFQVANVLLALGMARALGADPAALAGALPHLNTLPHRSHDLGWRAGRRVIDNGVSTTPDSTLSALQETEGPTTLLMGGRSKQGLSFVPLARELARRGGTALAFGADRALIATAMRAEGVRTLVAVDLEQAVQEAFVESAVGSTLLFSPACASFDAYTNFRERALAFAAALPEEEREPARRASGHATGRVR